MSIIGNILWFLLGGFISGLIWTFYGIIWCITVVGIPVGLQCFKFARLAFFPFGKEIVYGGGTLKLLLNIIWLITSGIPMAVAYAAWGCVLCITIVGVPFGMQFFKFAKLALMPLGSEVR